MSFYEAVWQKCQVYTFIFLLSQRVFKSIARRMQQPLFFCFKIIQKWASNILLWSIITDWFLGHCFSVSLGKKLLFHYRHYLAWRREKHSLQHNVTVKNISLLKQQTPEAHSYFIHFRRNQYLIATAKTCPRIKTNNRFLLSGKVNTFRWEGRNRGKKTKMKACTINIFFLLWICLK